MKNAEIKIIRATLDDSTAATLLELSKEWEAEDITYGYRANTREDLEEPCFLAKDGEEIVGYIFGHFYTEERKQSYCRIGARCFDVAELYVRKDHRGQGIGKRLFRTIEDAVKGEAEFITLPTATKDYRRILRFYDEEAGMTFHSAFLFKKL